MKKIFTSMMAAIMVFYAAHAQNEVSGYTQGVYYYNTAGPYSSFSSCSTSTSSNVTEHLIYLYSLNGTNYVSGIECYVQITSVNDSVWYNGNLVSVGDTMHGDIITLELKKNVASIEWVLIFEGVPLQYCQMYGKEITRAQTLGSCGESNSFGHSCVPNFEISANLGFICLSYAAQVGKNSFDTFNYTHNACADSITIGDNSIVSDYSFWNTGDTLPSIKVGQSQTYQYIYEGTDGCKVIHNHHVNLDPNYMAIQSEQITSCDSIIHDGITYYASQTFSDTLIGASKYGCDSIITINLTIKQSSTSNITAQSCDNYTAPDGQVYTTSGIKTAVLTNSKGCDSTITINLTIHKTSDIDTSVTVNEATLTSNTNTATYQWIDCANGNSTIEGETGLSFTATESGLYAVAITKNGCSATSACHEIIFLNINSNIESGIRIYPNPFTNEFNLSYPSSVSPKGRDFHFRLLGRAMDVEYQVVNKDIVIDGSKLEKGVYIIEISPLWGDAEGRGVIRTKVVKN